MLVHRSSGRLVESRDVHFDESGLVEPIKGEKESESDSDSSVDLQELLDGDSDDDDDGYDSDTSSKGYGTAGSSGSNARSSSAPDNDKNRSIGSATDFRAQKLEQSTSRPLSTSNSSSN